MRRMEWGETPRESVTVMPPLRGLVRNMGLGSISAGTGSVLSFRPHRVSGGAVCVPRQAERIRKER